MNFPSGVNYLNFYTECKRKGLKIISRYAGVHVHAGHNGRLNFKVLVFINKKRKTEYFPFSEQGELDAHKRYVVLQERQIEKRGTGGIKEYYKKSN